MSTKKSCPYIRYGMMCPICFYTQALHESAFLQELGVKFGRGCAPNPLFFSSFKKMKEYRKISAYFAILEGCLDFSKFLRAPCRARIKCETSCKPIAKPIELCTLRDTCAFLLGCSLSARWRAIKANCAHRWEVRNFLQT